MSFKKCLIGICVIGMIASITSANDLEATLQEYQCFNKRMSTFSGLSPLAKSAVATKAASVGGYSSTISSSTYLFDWAVLPTGWTWNYDETSYSSFYTLEQDYRGTLFLLGSFTVYIITGTGTPAYWARNDSLTISMIYTSVIKYKYAETTTFAGGPALHNSFSGYSEGINYSIDTWAFAHSGKTYEYKIRTTVADWNTNSTLYLLEAFSFTFRTPTLAKSQSHVIEKPWLRYFSDPVSKGTTFFDIPPSNSISIFDLNGKLIRTLNNTNYWDGKNSNGTPMRTGFYVSNIQSNEGVQSLKIQKR